MLGASRSRQRQKRLLEIMQQRQLDAVVVGATRHVYYFSAYLPFWLHESGFVLYADGRSLLVSPNSPVAGMAADEVVAFEANWTSTLRQEQPAAVAMKVLEGLKGRKARRVGVDASEVCSQVVLGFEGECESVDAELWQLRRRKDADELELMKKAIRCCEAMYAKAREM